MSAPKEFTCAADDWAQASKEIYQRMALSIEAEQVRSLMFLDTFDWRLYRAGYVLAHVDDTLELSDRETGTVVARAAAHNGTAMNGELPGKLRGRLAGVLGLRALAAVASVDSSSVVLAARNGDAKTVARLVLSDSRVDHGGRRATLKYRLSVVPLRGYDRHASRLSEELAGTAGVEPISSSLFEEAVAATGRRPGDYTSKLSLDLNRDVSTYDAARLIYRTLLQVMNANRAGVVQELDTEYLHDFRVAVRRTRSALKELAGSLPVELENRFRDEFRRLGQVTTPTRDLDVCLLEFPAFRQRVGVSSGDLDPLHALISDEKRRAHARLRTELRSTRYQRLCKEWSRAVDAEAPSTAAGPVGTTSIGELADARIRRVARHVLRDGSRIDDASPAESLHDLRKRCKELRYLLEFFSSLYVPKLHRSLLVELKALQLNLGQFQDTQVQRHALEEYAERLLEAKKTPAAALLAIGRLVAVLEDQQSTARTEFADGFSEFAGAKNRSRLSALTEARP